jgi:hypothetical protein
MRLAVALLGLFAATGMATPARADQKRASRLFDDALKLADAGRWDAACPKFRESHEAEPSVGAQLNVAKCSERAGLLLQAEDEYRSLLELNRSTRDPDRRLEVEARAKEALKALGARVPRVVVVARPASAKAVVSVDGHPPGSVASNGALRLDPGSHKVRVEADGFEPTEQIVTLKEREERPLEITLARVPADRVGPDDRGSELAVPGWAVGGAGLALAVAGGALLGVAASRASEIEELCGEDAAPPRCAGSPADASRATALSDEGRTMEIAGFTLLGVGGAALAAGVILVAVDAAGAPEREGDVALLPVVSQRGGGLWLGVTL